MKAGFDDEGYIPQRACGRDRIIKRLKPSTITTVAAMLMTSVAPMLIGQPAPTISNITNAAIPAIDEPPDRVHLTPRTIGSIFGMDLADAVASASRKGQTNVGGTEVHFMAETITYGVFGDTPNYTSECSTDCELVAELLYVSPTQINFIVPDNRVRSIQSSRIVIIRKGVRFDWSLSIMQAPKGKKVGQVSIDPLLGDPIQAPFLLFQVGYDCLYSFSAVDPGACGWSYSPGPHREALGAVTDASGALITPSNPVRQGHQITLWGTGLQGMTRNTSTGLLERNAPLSIGFGVAQAGQDMPSTIETGMEGPYGTFSTPVAQWAGESPEFRGLNQINVTFPVCDAPVATVEKRYDAFLLFQSIVSGLPKRIYLPFRVAIGDPDCQWTLKTSTSLLADMNPSSAGQTVTFTAAVTPNRATGSVSFMEGPDVLGTSVLNSGIATWQTSRLLLGTHSITARYNGDSNYGPSSTVRMHAVKAATALSINSNLNPSHSGQPITFTATVSPVSATGTITFFNGADTLGAVALRNGSAVCGVDRLCSTSNLSGGNYQIRAVYSGDTMYGGSSASLNQIVIRETTITLSTAAGRTITLGQRVSLTASVSCCVATGTVTFLSGGTPLGSARLVYQNGTVTASFSTGALVVGSHAITARYEGDASNASSESAPLTLTVWKLSTLTATPNPSTVGQMVTLSACGIPAGVSGRIAYLDGTTRLATNNIVFSPCSTYSSNVFAAGTHTITARYSDDYGGDTSASTTVTVTSTK